jgi:hypothetical protein
MDSLDKWPTLRKMDMWFGIWNVRSLYRAGSLMKAAKEISKYKLDLVGVYGIREELRWRCQYNNCLWAGRWERSKFESQ